MDTTEISLDKLFSKIPTLWGDREGKCNTESELNKLIVKDIPEYITKKIVDYGIDLEDNVVKGLPGLCGTWCNIMYIAILRANSNGKVITSASYGTYPCYLVSKDGKKLFLTYMLGTGTKSERHLINTSEAIIRKFPLPEFQIDKSCLDCINDWHRYKFGVIFYKKYDLDNIPNESILLEDLFLTIRYHNNFKQKIREYMSSL